MECSKSTGAQTRLRGKSIDAAFLFNRKSSFNCEMQGLMNPGESGEDLTKLMKRLRQMSWATGSTRRGSINVEKRAVSSFESRDRRSSLTPRYNGPYRYDSHKAGQWDMKANVPKRWLKEYEKKQVRISQVFPENMIRVPDYPRGGI